MLSHYAEQLGAVRRFFSVLFDLKDVLFFERSYFASQELLSFPRVLAAHMAERSNAEL